MDFPRSIYDQSGIDFYVWHEVGINLTPLTEKTSLSLTLLQCDICYKSSSHTCVDLFPEFLLWPLNSLLARYPLLKL